MLSVCGSSEDTLLKKLWLTSGMIIGEHTAERSFLGMAEVLACAAELASVLDRRESASVTDEGLLWGVSCVGFWLAAQALTT